MKSLILLLISINALFAAQIYSLNDSSLFSIADFEIDMSPKYKKIKHRVLKESFEVRRSIADKTNSPFVKIEITTKRKDKIIKLRYKNKDHYLIQDSKSLSASFFIDLLSDENVYIADQKEPLVTIKYIGIPKNIIDNSCFRYQVKMKSSKRISSAGCTLNSNGYFGSQTNTLNIHLRTRLNEKQSSSTKKTYKLHKPGVLTDKDLDIHANFPKRHNRLKTAIGFGPYSFDTSYPKDGEQMQSLRPLAPAFMLYANLELDTTNSVRFFNATVAKDAFFNNAGIYYASDLISLLNDDLTITSLLGFQHLHFKEGEDIRSFSEAIFPQGVEFLYKQPFGIKDYLISGGGFISTTSDIDYENLWIRWGRRYYWELNYIYWSDQDISAKMWGLSLIFPGLKLL